MLEWLFRHVTCEIGQDGRVAHPESFARSLPPTSSREDSETIEASSSALVLVLLEHVLHPKQHQKKKECVGAELQGWGKWGGASCRTRTVYNGKLDAHVLPHNPLSASNDPLEQSRFRLAVQCGE